MKAFELGSFKHKQELFSILLSFNSVIFVFYWTVMRDIKPDTSGLTVFVLDMDHSFPFAFTLIEFFHTDYEMEDQYMKSVAKISCAFLLVNFVWTFASGSPVYDIVTWVNVFSYVFACVVVASQFGFFKCWQLVRNKIRAKKSGAIDKDD